MSFVSDDDEEENDHQSPSSRSEHSTTSCDDDEGDEEGVRDDAPAAVEEGGGGGEWQANQAGNSIIGPMAVAAVPVAPTNRSASVASIAAARVYGPSSMVIDTTSRCVSVPLPLPAFAPANNNCNFIDFSEFEGGYEINRCSTPFVVADLVPSVQPAQAWPANDFTTHVAYNYVDDVFPLDLSL